MKKYNLISVLTLVILIGVLGFLLWPPVGAAADPITVPASIEVHLGEINSNLIMLMDLIKIAGGALFVLVGVISSLVVFIFLSTNKSTKEYVALAIAGLKESINTTDRKASKALEKTDMIEREFVSTDTHDRICIKQNGGT